MTAPVLKIDGLATVFELKAGSVQSVNEISLKVHPGEVLGLVGESGSGKSVTGLSVMGLIEPPGRIVSGRIELLGQDISHLAEREMRKLRGRKISMIFQDPMSTLNPVLTIGRQFYEVLRAHERISWSDSRERAEAALTEVGIPAPRERLDAYPHELSGGMRQRVCIAMSLIGDPDVVIADEPTTALDVTIQSQILHMMQRIVAERNVAMIWITHDLSVVAGFCDSVAVMYGGRIVETGPAEDILGNPAHPYTYGLLASIPVDSDAGQMLKQIPGTQPSPLALPSGCAFRTRCAHAYEQCLQNPPLAKVSDERHARCHSPFVAAKKEQMQC